ncbi:RhoGAP domain-containing protein [Seiridium cupressi]
MGTSTLDAKGLPPGTLHFVTVAVAVAHLVQPIHLPWYSCAHLGHTKRELKQTLTRRKLPTLWAPGFRTTLHAFRAPTPTPTPTSNDHQTNTGRRSRPFHGQCLPQAQTQAQASAAGLFLAGSLSVHHSRLAGSKRRAGIAGSNSPSYRCYPNCASFFLALPTVTMDDYLESPMESEDSFPCKGCGEILEEGKAFELAGNRWHLNCFRCNTCGTLLDSDANLLLLGDGSLICNNCTYSCSACGNKIEDLAILTGDQAFCATCFRCRNCKRKIENLRYARTSQGIFCMSCHESLMARRRKKSKAAAQAKSREKESSPMIVDKSLPALPPNAIPNGAFSNDRVDPDSDTPTELSPRPRPSYSHHDSSSRSSSRPARSPERVTEHRDKDSGLSLPQTSYRNNRNSSIFTGSDAASNTAGDDQGFFIPVALDPSPAPSVTPRSTAENLTTTSNARKEKDYFSIPKSEPEPRRKEHSQASTPHIAFQEKGRQTSSDYESSPAKDVTRRLSKSSKTDKSTQPRTSATINEKVSNGKPNQNEEFKLQEAPKSKKVNARSTSQSSGLQDVGSRSSQGSGKKDKEGATTNVLMDSPQLLQAGEKSGTPRSSQDSRFRDDDEVRSNDSSISSSNPPRPIARKELPPSASRMSNGTYRPGVPGSEQRLRSITGNTKPRKHSDDLAPPPPPRPPVEQKLSDSYMTPRAPPAPPSHPVGKDASGQQDSLEPRTSPKLPRWSAGGDFSMEEDLARILGTDENSTSIMRRVSNAVRHGRTNSAEQSNSVVRVGHARSVSESTRTTASPRWPKTPLVEDPLNGQTHDITSPISLATNDDPALLKRRLRNSEQRVAELERQFTSEKDLQNITERLEEKRKTVSVLDTQTEIMIRQLEVLAGYVEKAKDTKRPIDPRDLEESAIKEFVQKLEKLKQSMSASLEQLHAERNTLVEEKNQAIADRDRALLEFEQLSSKNAQLADMNNDLTHQIQERFKNHSDVRPPMNGLGIYHQHKGTSNHSISLDNSSIQTGTTLIPDQEEPILEAGPTVVNIRKGKVQKFSWKKGSKAMAQNIAKGVNRTVGALQQPERRDVQFAGENIGLPYNMTHTPVESPVSQVPMNGQQQRQNVNNEKPGFFGFKKSATMPRNLGQFSNNSNLDIAEAADVLFGSDLSERADFEKRHIPCVVTRCIEEVELRGMDMEGIYRKTGGNSQVKMIQEGFDKNENFDISDPDLDITAVTSVLKQYFRKLPIPLLTYDVYDRILEINSITDNDEKCDHLRKTFNLLPQKHRDCLEFLMFHLVRVAQRERENLMSPKNLAVVFAPTIMRDKTIEREMTDMHAKNTAVQFIIENSQTIFSED